MLGRLDESAAGIAAGAAGPEPAGAGGGLPGGGAEGDPPFCGTIYLITHKLTGRRYVGQTSRPVMRRWVEHSSIDKYHRSAINAAILAEGREAFDYRVLMTNVPTPEALGEWEARFVLAYDACGRNGYNQARGGLMCYQRKTAPSDPEMVAAYCSGLSLAEVGALFGCCGSTVLNNLKKAGVPRRRCGGRKGEFHGRRPDGSTGCKRDRGA